MSKDELETEKPGEGPLTPNWGDPIKPERIAPPVKERAETPTATPTAPRGTYADVAPITNGQRPHWQFYCMGVAQKKLKMVGQSHELPYEAKPDQPTTDVSGKYMYGHCTVCNTETVWKERA